MAIDISLEVNGNGSDAVSFVLMPVQALDLAYELERGAKQYKNTDKGKFYFSFVYSFISCSQQLFLYLFYCCKIIFLQMKIIKHFSGKNMQIFNFSGKIIECRC